MAKRKRLAQSVTVTDVTTFCCRRATEDAGCLTLDVRAAAFVATQSKLINKLLHSNDDCIARCFSMAVDLLLLALPVMCTEACAFRQCQLVAYLKKRKGIE